MPVTVRGGCPVAHRAARGWQSGPVQRWSSLADVPPGFGPSVVTVGNFDGVHRGHQAVLGRLVADARAAGASAVAITFDPHPLAVLRPEHAPTPLQGLTRRLDLMARTGLDAVLVMEFTHELATWSPERFVADVLVGALHVSGVVVGRDMRFGHRNSGDVGTLRELGARHGYEVDLVDDLGGTDEAHPSGRRWSSTWVRELLAAGDVEGAAEVLGRPHETTGRVVHGDHRGRELGYPTANLAQDAEGMVPADGVYAGRLTVLPGEARPGEEALPAAISVGTNPTFDGVQRRVEAYVLDRTDLELYDRTVRLQFVSRLRPTLRFDGIEPLVEQMKLDVDRSRELLGS
jgi:riboflavin kinase / FMN adenylyltransferase